MVTVRRIDDERRPVSWQLPLLRSDRAAAAGATIVLGGLRQSGTSAIIYLQEVSGASAVVTLQFVNEEGTVVRSRSESLGGLASMAISGPFPVEAIAAFIEVETTSTGRVKAIALLTDIESGDVTVISDWSRLGSAQRATQVVPLVSSRREGSRTTTRTELVLTNRGIEPATGELSYFGATGAGRKRPAQPGSAGSREAHAAAAGSSRTLTLRARQSIVIDDVTEWFRGRAGSEAPLLFTPGAGEIALSAKLITTSASALGGVGSSVPVVPVSTALTSGQTRTFVGVDDAGPESIRRRVGGTARSSLGLFEVGGETVTVRVSLDFGSTRGSATGSYASRLYTLAAFESLLIAEVVADLLGPNRSDWRDLTQLRIAVEVTGGRGAALPYLLSVDNASEDTMIRLR
jgi:hypothetical protein